MPSESVWVTISPQRCLCGLAFFGDDVLRVRLAVLPKLWKPAQPQATAAYLLRDDASELSIVAYEGETVCIRLEGSIETVRARKEILLKFLQGLMTPDAGSEADETALQFVRFARRPTDSPDFDPRDHRDRAFPDAVVDLYKLAVLAAHQLTLALGRRAPASLRRDLLLLPLIHADFLRCVQSAISHTRRGYFETTADCDTIRGRPMGLSLARAAEGISRYVECTFDDFDYATPLLRVIATCLDEVVRFNQVAAGSPLSTLARINADNAVKLRRRFPTVPRLAPSVAVRLSTQITPSRNEQAWSEALQLAPTLLARKGVHESHADNPTRLSAGNAGSSDQDGGYLYRFTLRTAKIWEQLLLDAARTLGLARAQAALPSPWEGLGGELCADIQLVLQDQTRLLIDAKYKTDASDGIPGDDLLQMFAYSHLTDWGGRRQRLLMVRARALPMTPDQRSYLRYQRRPLPTGRAELVTASLLWPSRSQLDRPNHYRNLLQSELQSLVVEHQGR